MNCVCITGTSVSVAKCYTSKTGKNITSFTLAVSDKYKDASGEVEHTVYIDCAAYGRMASYASHIEKGSKVEVQGQLTSYKYTTKNGEIKFKVQVHVNSLSIRANESSEAIEEAMGDSDEFMETEGGEY